MLSARTGLDRMEFFLLFLSAATIHLGGASVAATRRDRDSLILCFFNSLLLCFSNSLILFSVPAFDASVLAGDVQPAVGGGHPVPCGQLFQLILGQFGSIRG